MKDKHGESLSILRLMLTVGETSASYNQFSLAWSDKHDITICSFFKSDVIPPKEITLFEGDGSITGFIRTLKAALDDKEYDLIHAHSPHVGFLFFVASLFPSWDYTIPTVVTVHDSYQNYKLRNRLLYLPIFASFNRTVCCGKASYESFPQFYKWLAGNRLSYVQNGLDLARVDRIAANIKQKPLQTDLFTIIAVSRLVDIKNPTSVIAAFEKSKTDKTRLIYIGDGPLRQSLIANTKEARQKNQVEFTGIIPREEVFEQLLSADLFISTSYGEGLPVAALEAMACECPVLLSDIPPHREITEGVDFIPIIKPDDVVGFTREIIRIQNMSASDRSAIGKQCREIVEEKFSLTAMHAGYTEVYSQVTSNKIPSH